MRQSAIITIFALGALVMCARGEETKAEPEKETDNKAMETKTIKMKTEPESGSEKGKRAPVLMTAVPTSLNSLPAHTKVMIMPPVSLMLAMPHPSGRFLMLFPTTQLVPIMPMPYAHSQATHNPSPSSAAHHPSVPASSDHPAIFAARQQMLYNGPNYQQQREQQYYQPYTMTHTYNGGYKRIQGDMN